VSPDEGVHRLSIPTPFAVGRVNCWLIDDDPLTLVDTGPNSGLALDELEQALAWHGRRVEDLERIVVTHQHMDHEGLVGVLARRSDAEVCALDVLAPVLEDFGAAQEADDQLAETMMRRHGLTGDVVTALRALSRLARAWGGSAAVGRRLAHGDELGFAGRTLRVLHRPGHSPSDTVFHDAARGLLIGGDHLLAHISSNALIARPLGGRSGAPGDRPRPLLTYLASLRETAAMDDVELVVTGHGDPVTAPRALIEERFGLVERRAERILGILAAGGERTVHEIATALWAGTALTQAYLTLSEVLGHLDLLAERGAVAELPADGGVVRFSAV
jgi:glyoxylase-like metal-dependent hydrolase (beta-lactamase superfamily II)